MPNTNIADLFADYPGLKQDIKNDWKEDAKLDWKVDWGALATTPAAPTNSVQPSITGTAQVGQTLTAVNGTWAGFPALVYTYKWSSGGVYNGATGTTYVPVASDVGKVITVLVTATNIEGTLGKISTPTAAVIA